MRFQRLLALAALALLSPLVSGAAGPPDLGHRDLHGDPLPEGALVRLGTTRLRHEQAIQCLAFSPDGKTLLTGGYSRNLVYWDRATGKEIKRVLVGPHGISSIQFSANGKVLALGCNDGTVRILDPVTGVERKTLTDPMRNYSNTFVVLAPDGKSLIATAQYGRDLLLWDVEGARIRHRLTLVNNNYQALAAVFTPDSKRFLTPYNDNKLHVFETSTGRDLRVLESAGPPSDTTFARIQGLAISPDGKTLAVGNTGRQLTVIDLARDKVVKRLELAPNNYHHYSANWWLAFTHNGRFLVDLRGPSLLVWGVASGKALRAFPVPTNHMPQLALTRDGKLAAAASGNVVSLFDLSAGKQLHAGAGHKASVMKLIFTPDGKGLISGGGSTLRAWDAGTGKELHQLTSGYSAGVQHFALSRDGKGVRWVGYDRTLYEWRPGADTVARRLTTPAPSTVYYSQSVVSPDGKMLAAINNTDQKLQLIDLTSNKPGRDLTVLAQPWSTGLAFSPDGKRLALATTDRTLRVFDVATATSLWTVLPVAGTGHFYSPRVEFSPDGRSLIRLDTEMRCYEVANGGERYRLGSAGGNAAAMAWSRDGRLVARSMGEGTVVVYDIYLGRELLRRDGKQGPVASLAFSPDGRRLASGGANTTILVWDVPAPPVGKGPLDKTALWRDLEGNDAGRAFKAMAALSSGPGEAIPLLKERLKPRPPADAKAIGKLIADLDSNDYDVRETAEEELAKLGVGAEEALARAAKSPSLEVRRRVETLLARLQGVPLERLRVLRAIEVLERSGTPAARGLLRQLAKYKLGTLLEGEIQGSLERLAERDEGGRINPKTGPS